MCVIWDGVEIFATTLVALEMALIAPAMVFATLLPTSALAMKAGLELVVKFLTVQGPLIVSYEAYVMPHWIPQGVKIVQRGGWGRPAKTLAQMVNKFLWTVATVFVSQDGLELAVIVNAQSMEGL